MALLRLTLSSFSMVRLGGPSLSLSAGCPNPGPRSDWNSETNAVVKSIIVNWLVWVTIRGRPACPAEEHGMEYLGPEDGEASQHD